MLQTGPGWGSELEAHRGYHLNVQLAASLGRPIAWGFGAYLELFALVGTEAHVPYQATFDAGITYKILDDLQLDCGINVGLTEYADDLNPFVGVTFRY